MHPFEERWPRFWAFMEHLAVIVMSGLLFWLFSVLVVTIPAALAALYAAVGGLVRPAQGSPYLRFWRAFRGSFGTALLLGLLDLVAGIILYVDIRFFWSMGTTWSKAITFLFASFATALVMMNVFAWPLLAWYPQRIGSLLKRSFLLAAAHPLYAIGAVLAPAAVIFLFLLLPGPLMGLLPALGPGLAVAVVSAIAWQAMKRYAQPEDEFHE